MYKVFTESGITGKKRVSKMEKVHPLAGMNVLINVMAICPLDFFFFILIFLIVFILALHKI